MVKEIPQWLRPYLNIAGAQSIEAAVKSAEQETSGEIVPMLVYRSTHSSATALLSSLSCLLLFMALKLVLMLGFHVEGQDLWWAIGFFAATGLGYYLGRLAFIERWFIPKQDQKAAVEQRAMLAFYQLGLSATEGKTGILLFVSFFERRAVVLADQGIAQHCQAEVFQGLVKQLVSAAKKHELAAGFEKAIMDCKDILKDRFPSGEQNPNELMDYLRISW